MSNVDKVKLLSERTSGVPPVIFAKCQLTPSQRLRLIKMVSEFLVGRRDYLFSGDPQRHEEPEVGKLNKHISLENQLENAVDDLDPTEDVEQTALPPQYFG